MSAVKGRRDLWRRFLPPRGRGAQKALGWNEPAEYQTDLEAMIARYRSAYPPDERRDWIEQRLRAWWRARG